MSIIANKKNDVLDDLEAEFYIEKLEDRVHYCFFSIASPAESDFKEITIDEILK